MVVFLTCVIPAQTKICHTTIDNGKIKFYSLQVTLNYS